MHNSYLAESAKIKKVITECADVKTYQIFLTDKKKQKLLDFEAGQFFMLGVPGVGEAPISISSSPHIKKYFELTIRLAGKVTEALDKMKAGDDVTVRGPFGRGWPKIKIDDEVILVAGGIGLPAVKPLLDDYCKGYLHCQRMQLFYGTTHFQKMVCMRYYALWEKETQLFMSLDNKDPHWKKHVGFITELISKAKISPRAKAFVIGPPIMYKFVLKELKKKKIEDRHIFLSLERRMHCGVGTCQHCACGDRYACQDGPVFRYDKIKNIPEII